MSIFNVKVQDYAQVHNLSLDLADLGKLKEQLGFKSQNGKKNLL